jgi:hypothetical protein
MSRRYSSSTKSSPRDTRKSNIYMYCSNVASFLKIYKYIISCYRINTADITVMCQHNTNVAAIVERSDLVQTWCLADLIITQMPNTDQSSCQSSQSDIDSLWPLHPWGQNLIHSL